jgi:hypothetical protein
MAAATFSTPLAIERVVGRDIPTEGLLLPEAILARVEAATATAELSSLSQLASNWDGYGALPIDPRTIQNSRKAIELLVRGLPAPDISPNPNGTISFIWDNDHGIAHLEIGITRFSFYIRQVGGEASVLDGDATSIPFLGSNIAALLFARDQPVSTITQLIYTADYEQLAA